jgi:hypothetical protein
MLTPTDLHTNHDRSQAVGRSLDIQGSFNSLSASETGHGDLSVKGRRKIQFITTTFHGTLKNFTLHYHAPREFEKFHIPLPRAMVHSKISQSTTTSRGTLKNFLLHYHTPWDFEKFPSPQPRAAGL